MSKFYSETTDSFYDSIINTIMPSDAVEITDDLWLSLLNAQSLGEIIQSGPNGFPISVSPPSPTLSQVQNLQIQYLNQSYKTAISEPVSYTTSAGVTKTFDSDSQSVQNISNMILTFTSVGVTPAGFYWVSEDNIQVTFTFTDLQNLAKTIGVQGWLAFQNLQIKKTAILAATTIAAVQSITW